MLHVGCRTVPKQRGVATTGVYSSPARENLASATLGVEAEEIVLQAMTSSSLLTACFSGPRRLSATPALLFQTAALFASRNWSWSYFSHTPACPSSAQAAPRLRQRYSACIPACTVRRLLRKADSQGNAGRCGSTATLDLHSWQNNRQLLAWQLWPTEGTCVSATHRPQAVLLQDKCSRSVIPPGATSKPKVFGQGSLQRSWGQSSAGAGT